MSEFVESILARTVSPNMVTSYRGHGSIDFKLQPSIFRRHSTKENEHILLRELIAAHPEDFHGDTSALETLVRMQHYSLPTRLLDVTFNPLVALYFACEIVKKRVPIKGPDRPTTRTIDMDGHVVVLTVHKRRIRYFDSDTVSCLANLARLSWNYKKKIDTDLEQTSFNDSTPVKRLLHFIRQEKNGFLPEIDPSDLDSILLVKPKQNNKRILAQAGAFFAFGLDEEIVSGSADQIRVERITVDAKSKPKILGELDKLGINEKTMFPEIERAARYITGTLSAGDTVSKLI
ncbi:FRG domain-containing protein [Novosphingobium sp.]|uniref:FRG domain-containing protein n=1 Tax=Novosphingobium sp. TaxID=1874826 RepID=UPI00263695E0|nr:FRG domain-containing protein [Novosphingobium sp.]